MRISSYLPVFAAAILGALLSILGASIGAKVIETTSEKSVISQLTLEGYDWATVQADGLQIVLTGTAPDEIEQLAAQRAAGRVVDPARVLNVMDVEQEAQIIAPDFSIEILRNDNGISLIGLVPTAWDKDSFVDGIRRNARTGSIADLLEQADYPIPEGWGETSSFGADAIELLPRSKVSLSAGEIRIEGLADSSAQKAFLETALARAEPDNVTSRISISAPRPVISPFTVRFLMDENGARFDACAAETPVGHARILATARAMGISDPECTVGLGAPSPRWANAVEEAMRALSELGSGAVTLSDNEVTLVGVAGQSRKTFEEIAGDLDAALPSSFTLHTNFPQEEADQGEDGNSHRFAAVLSPEGQLRLRGMVQDERSKLASEAVARAHFGSDRVYSATRLDPSLPDGWTDRVLATLDALAEVDQGSASMTTDSFVVTGQTGKQGARAEIARILADKLGEGQSFDINVTYNKKLDPTLNIPTPAQCVESANQVLTASKIVFEPGSTDVDASSFATLDAIAAALKNCENVGIEIGGHTDSQGREEMNLNLSQSRANSVLDALLARRVAGVTFDAKGYGETQPIADNETEDGREANRRIEFKLIAQADDAAKEETTTEDTQTGNAEE